MILTSPGAIRNGNTPSIIYSIVFGLIVTIILFVWPPLAIIFIAFTLSFFPALNSNTFTNFSIALTIGAITATRVIPALPSDDLEEYLIIYQNLKGMGFFEFLDYVRFEPLFYFWHYLVDLDYSNERLILLLVSTLIALAYVYAIKNSLRFCLLPKELLGLGIVLFPYEIVSSIPRQMLAVFLLQALITSIATKKYLTIAIVALTHKTSLLASLLSIVRYTPYTLYFLLAFSIFLAFSSFDLILRYIELDVFARMRSYFLREGSSGLFPFVIFSAVSVGAVLFRNLRPFLMMYVPLLGLSLALSELGPLSIRLSYYGYIPTLMVLFAILSSLLTSRKGRVWLIILSIYIFLSVRLALPPNGDHDPFSQVGVENSWFFIHRVLAGSYD